MTYSSLGSISLPLATPRGIAPVYITCNVISADIPALLVLNDLDFYSLMVDTVSNRLVKRVLVPSNDRGGGTSPSTRGMYH